LQRSNLTSSNNQRSTPLHAIAGILPDKPSNAPRKTSSGFEAPDRLRHATWPVRSDQDRPIRADAISVVPVAVGVAEVAVLANRKGDEWRPGRAEPLRGPSPWVAVAAGQQHIKGVSIAQKN
jgi:hypothetical protein